jgi:gluconate 2-dehydrogenase gamma chain
VEDIMPRAEVDNQQEEPLQPDRRGFHGVVVAAAGAASLTRRVFFAAAATAIVEAPQPSSAQPPTSDGSEIPPPAVGYTCFGPPEASFVEALVNVMCPADGLTPNGVDCGLAVFMDRQLTGGFGKGERLYMRGPWLQGKPQHGYQLPLTPEQFFKVGIAAADAACRERYGKNFDELAGNEADGFLHDLAASKISDKRVPLASWFNELVYPLFVQACFSDPIYGGNVGKVFWRMIGYPGLPAIHAQDMLDFRGKPYPGAADPKSIADFS